MDWGVLVIVWLICAVIAAVVSDRKNLGAGSGFVLGAVLGVIGIIIVACQKPGLPPAPRGMRAVKSHDATRCRMSVRARLNSSVGNARRLSHCSPRPALRK
jgi:hypothetical protein